MSFVNSNALPPRARMLAGLLLLSIHHSSPVHGENNIEFKIKAAYLYNFTKFIEWPERISATFNLCVIGDSPLKSMLSSLESKTVQDQPIRIRYFDNINQVADCQIAYFEQLELSDAVLLAPQLNKTLTVGSHDGFAEHGGMIGFVLEQEKLKLHINVQAIKRQGLSISAKLIEVATLVTGAENE